MINLTTGTSDSLNVLTLRTEATDKRVAAYCGGDVALGYRYGVVIQEVCQLHVDDLTTDIDPVVCVGRDANDTTQFLRRDVVRLLVHGRSQIKAPRRLVAFVLNLGDNHLSLGARVWPVTEHLSKEGDSCLTSIHTFDLFIDVVPLWEIEGQLLRGLESTVQISLLHFCIQIVHQATHRPCLLNRNTKAAGDLDFTSLLVDVPTAHDVCECRDLTRCQTF